MYCLLYGEALSQAGIARDIGENLGIWRIYVSRGDETVAAMQYK
jgi:hypothetical protein